MATKKNRTDSSKGRSPRVPMIALHHDHIRIVLDSKIISIDPETETVSQFKKRSLRELDA